MSMEAWQKKVKIYYHDMPRPVMQILIFVGNVTELNICLQKEGHAGVNNQDLTCQKCMLSHTSSNQFPDNAEKQIQMYLFIYLFLISKMKNPPLNSGRRFRARSVYYFQRLVICYNLKIKSIRIYMKSFTSPNSS